jgi:hypothetical protein
MAKDTEPVLLDTMAVPIQSMAELPIRLTRKAPREAAEMLEMVPDVLAARALSLVNPALTVDILSYLPEERRRAESFDPSRRDHAIGNLFAPRQSGASDDHRRL